MQAGNETKYCNMITFKEWQKLLHSVATVLEKPIYLRCIYFSTIYIRQVCTCRPYSKMVLFKLALLTLYLVLRLKNQKNVLP